MILVTGCNPISTRLAAALGAGTARGACDRASPAVPGGFLTYDATSDESIDKLMGEQRPSAVVLAEEIDNVEYCQRHRVEAMELNTRAVRFFAESAKKAGVRVAYRSTAYVFDGRKQGGLYTETDKVNPINVYGETKLMGEVHVDKVPEFLIVRLGEVYGAGPDDFAGHVVRQLQGGAKVELARDMYFSPIYIDDVVAVMKTLTENRMAGFYNVAGPERVSHYEFGRRVAAAAGASEDLVIPVSADALGMSWPMPRDTSLDIGKISPLFKPRNIADGLAALSRVTHGTKG